MKREGRQHGMVRTFRVLPDQLNPRPCSRLVNKLDCPPRAGSFTKVRPNPTNHSKFTGKCGKPRCTECHIRPPTKSKDKTKGARKTKYCDVVSDYRLMSWRVVNGQPGLNFSGFSSATGMLDHMNSIDYMDDEADDDDGFIAGEINDGSVKNGEIQENLDHVDDNEEMGFCDVGLVLEEIEGDYDDDGWCIVGVGDM